MKLAEIVQSGDWKGEKHVPVIEAPESVKAGENFSVSVSVGKEIPHPNTTEHHIRWIQLLFKPDGGKFAYELGKVTFEAHGESVEGANKGPAYAEPFGVFQAKLSAPGVLVAVSFCNIHGLWESERRIDVA
jgi:superoxide reductase